MDVVAGFVYLKHDSATLTLLAVAVVVVVARMAGKLFGRFHQPPVMGEIVAGLALGPSVLGRWSATLFPLTIRPQLRILATLGLVLFMFLVGMDMNLGHLTNRRQRVSGAVAVGGTAVPFALGALLGLTLHHSHASAGLVPFVLFMGAAISITAFPVLARILQERGLYDTPLGALAMASAAGGDLLTWATLALVVAVATSAGALELPWIGALTVAFGTLLVAVVRPLLARHADRVPSSNDLALVVAAVLACAFATSAIGIHEIFGAFLFGAVFPRGLFADQLRPRVEAIATVLLPVFFVTTGLNVDLGGLGIRGLWQFGLILVIACAGKLAGAAGAARGMGLALRESLALGVLMNTRGLTELVVLNIGLGLGVLDRPLFSLLVLMAVVTTLATAPLLGLLRPDPGLRQEPDAT